MTIPQTETYLELAGRMADAVRPVSMRYFRSGLGVENKSDDSPVTLADREAETVMRQILEKEVPDHGIVGEEHGIKDQDAEFVWVLDPIDGTQGFITGKPLFGTLIALLHNGKPLIGIIDMPALGERWTGVTGQPTLFEGQPVQTRSCPELGEAWLYATSPQMFEGDNFIRFEKLRTSCRRAVYGADCLAYGLLSSGWVDVVCEDNMQPYDYAALIPVVEGAGGVITDWHGKALDLSSEGHVIAVGDPALHEAALKALS